MSGDGIKDAASFLLSIWWKHLVEAQGRLDRNQHRPPWICSVKVTHRTFNPGDGSSSLFGSTNMASWYSGNYVGLSRRRQGFNSPWGRQWLIAFSLKIRNWNRLFCRVLLIIGIRPVSSSGCRITEVSVAWDHVAKVRLLLLRPNVRVTELA